MRHTFEATLDQQGRITIPDALSGLAGIEREVLFVGAGEVIEVWEPGRYARYVEGAGEELDRWLARFL